MIDDKVELREADYAKLEKLVAKIQRDLAPSAEVLHNVRLPGRNSGRDRQIDVLMRQRVGQYDIMIVIDCKDYKSPVDVKGVEEFWGLVDDVGAQKGVLVCPAGFTRAAKSRAQGLQMDLYSPVDTDPHKWQARVTIPAICDFRSAGLSFGVQMSAPFPFRIMDGFFDQLHVFTPAGADLGTAFSMAINRWNKGEYDTSPGDHERVSIFREPEILIDNGYGQLVPVELDVGVRVTQQLFYGQFPISRISGFKDEINGGVIANAFEVGLLDPEEVQSKWRKIGTLDEAPVPPLFRMTGLLGWSEE